MRADGVLLSFVFPALTFARVGSELDRSPASFADRLLDQPGLPHISPTFRGHRAHVLESVIVFSFIRRLLGGVETIVDPRRGARRALDHSGRAHVLPLPADRPGAGGGGDAIACGAALLGSAYLAWCVAIALARRNGAPASLWMTLGFHHYAHSLVGRGLFYARLANGRIRFPRCGGCLVWIAPIGFLCAYPFL